MSNSDIKYDFIPAKYPDNARVVASVAANCDLLNARVVEGIYRNAAQLPCARNPRSCQLAFLDIQIYQNGKLAIKSYTGNSSNITVEGAIETAKQQERHYLREQTEKEKAQKETIDRKTASQKLFNEFSTKNSVQTWVARDKLFTNPFSYEGKIVGTLSAFDRMLSATEGVFDTTGHPFFVSNIPKAFFTSSGSVLLAAKVIGSKEISIPLVGMTKVPHLKFVGEMVQ